MKRELDRGKEKVARAICRRHFSLFWDRFREDALQECALVAWAHRELEGVSFLRAAYRELYGAARAYGCAKRSNGVGHWVTRERPTADLFFEHEPAPKRTPEEEMALDLFHKLLRARACRAGLRSRMAAAKAAALLVLTLWGGLSLREAADRVGLGYQAAKQARLRALRAIKL